MATRIQSRGFNRHVERAGLGLECSAADLGEHAGGSLGKMRRKAERREVAWGG